MPLWLSHFAKAEAQLGRFDDAWRYIGKAIAVIEASKQRLYEADVHRIAGEIALMSPQSDAAKAQAYFERALAVAQQAKSWELRAAMSRARLWCDQGKPQQARELLAPVWLVHRSLRHARSEGERRCSTSCTPDQHQTASCIFVLPIVGQ